MGAAGASTRHISFYDFGWLHTQDGRPLRLLNMVDEYTRKDVGFDIARSIGGRRVKTTLERLFVQHQHPELIRSDNGKEFTSTGLVVWLAERGVTAVQVAKGSPQ